MDQIKTGLKGKAEKIVAYEDTAAALGNGSVEVFSTPHMVLLVELACVDAVKECLKEGEATVGVNVNLSHLGPTPVGVAVKAVAELIDVKGRMLTFNVEINDENGKVGAAVHKRAVVDLNKFLNK